MIFHGNSTHPDVLSTELRFPSDADLGTGTYSILLQPTALNASEPLVSELVEVVEKRKIFRVLATINPDKGFEVRLATPRQTLFTKLTIPADTDPALPHTIAVSLSRSAVDITIDKRPLA